MKFVIHYHDTKTAHYDLMVEHGDSLLTWQIDKSDIENLLVGKKITCRKIQDHRKKYLDYEGPISCDRGRVNIYDSGEYSNINWREENKELIVNGAILKGKLRITKSKDPEYFLEVY
ncbi:DNA polymerase ligase N-terminal domain-containing protein [Spirochaetota bacterium]